VAAPQTEAERVLLAIWQQVLGIDGIGVTDGFFALGGDSIVAIQVASRAVKQGLAIQPRHVIEDKTIRRLAARIEPAAPEAPAATHESKPAAIDAELAGLDAAQLEALQAAHPTLELVYPCTGMQQSMLLHSAREPKDGLYISQLQVTLDAVDPARLRAAWAQLMQRHAVLRTAFVDIGGESLLQLVMSSAELPWRELDLRAEPAALAACLEAERRDAFDAAKAPLMRLLLVRTGDASHMLAWTYHHALIDGWSMATLMKQLLEAYAAPQAADGPVPGPAYRSYMAWLAEQDTGAAAAYWRRHFDGVAVGAAARLPADLLQPAAADRAAVNVHEQRVVSLQLPRDQTARLAQMARGEGIGLATVMLGVWGLLLSKYNAEPQVLFGYASSGRPHALPDIEHTAGLFINSLPLCLTVDGAQTLGGWLGAIQSVQLDHEDHGFLPLADIQRAAGVPRAQPLFDSLVVVENFPLDRAALGGHGPDALRVQDVQGTGRDGFGLTLVVYPGDSLKLDLVYQAQKVGDTAAQAMLVRLGRLLGGFADGASQPLGALSMLSTDERALALGAWNDTRRPYACTAPITALFDAQADARGHARALVTADGAWSYAELAQRSKSIAAWLRAHGVRRGDKVALSLDKGPTLIAAMLGILRCGAAYVPVAVDCPPDRRAFIAADAGIRHAVTRTALAAQVAVPGVLTLAVEEAGTAAVTELEYQGADAPDADTTAYVIYTSGTTGTPKGVAVSHRNLVNFCTWCIEVSFFAPGERVTQFAPYTFDASAGEIFGTLIAGAELHLLADAMVQDPRALTRYLCEHDIRFAAFPPSYAQHIDPTAVPATLSLLTAGSAPTPELVQRWGAQRRYFNGYGPTETTILSSAWVCEPGTIDGRGLSIGRPISNTTMYVVDRLGQLCAPGLVGEIWIGGDGVAQGYVNRPELTAQQFIADPFSPGGRVYRTGDLGRWRDDGCIEFVGRRDRQVKLRGFRIELGEIEARLREHAEVAEAVVLVRGDNDAQQLLAWVVTKPGASSQPAAARAAALRAFLRQTLPDYMLPQAIAELDSLPLGVNGKIDEKALPMPELGTAGSAAAEAPRTPAEARIAQVWAAVLKIDAAAIGVHANFFDLGGHSLMAMRVASRLLDEHGVEVGVADLFAHPVLADLAAHIEQITPCTLPPIEPAPRGRPLPLSFAQRRLWFLDQIEGASQAYQVPGLLRLRGALDQISLRAALQRLMARHESLRTTFDAVDGEPVQCIGPTGQPFELQLHDVSGQADAEQAMHAQVAHALGVPFDLARGPLVRAHLVRVGADDHVLLIAMHHIATDGWSLALLLQELATLYAAFTAGEADPMPPLALQYADYACWQQQWQIGPLWQAQCAHWQQALHGAPPLLDLPADRPRPAQQDHAGATLEFTLDAATRDGLVALGKRHGTTLFMTVLAAWSVVLSRLAGQHDVVVGTPVANRARLETEPMIGFFVNLLALRLDLSGQPTLAQLLKHVRQQVLDGQRHQQLPFEQVVDIVQPPRSLAHTPLFQVMLNWNERSLEGFALGGLHTTALRPHTTQSKYDLTLDIGEQGDGIVGVFEYASALFDEATIRRHAGYLQRVIAAMLADAAQPVQTLDLLGDEETRLLESFNATDRPELATRCWQELFDAQAARTPARVAVRCDGESLSYAELQRRATARAAALAARGAGPGETVALIDERGIELLVSMVAVLKTGAAYLPLDPAHPTQRWADSLQQAQPLLLWAGDTVPQAATWLRGHWGAERVLGTAELLMPTGGQGFVARRAPAPDDLAYVLFTSGSTGTPKGVQIEQRGMVNNMLAKVEPLGLGERDVIAQTASQCFDISVWQFLGALLFGARVLIVRSEIARDPQALMAHLAAEGATVWEPVPSVLQAALDAPRALPALRWVMPTGEALPRELAARWFERYPKVPMMNAYGPAECSDDVAMQPLHAPVDRVLIGRPVANARLHVLGEELQRQPLGAVGELAVSGLVVGRGYVGRPAETAAAFCTNPYATGPDDQRLYRTGDLVRRWPDGSLEYIGRKDFQVKLRGFRIELGEIEACLVQHPAVREAVVVLRECGADDRRLVAYVTLQPGAAADACAFEPHLAARLPEYMRPAAIVQLGRLPLNANGKVDRNALPEPTEAAYARADYEAPQTDTERTLAAVWQALLQIPRVGRADSYFDLGGNSLMLVRLLARLKVLGFELGLTEVYQLRTLAACAAAIDARRAGAAGWPLDTGWQHQIVVLGDGSARTVLLLDRSEEPRHAALQALLAGVPAAERPHLVRYADDVPELARRIAGGGLGVLLESVAARTMVRALRRQGREYVRACDRAAVQGDVAFSPIQRNLLAWQQRDGLDVIRLCGWYSAAELQQAFAAVAAEQDMLHVVHSAQPAQWCLLDPAAVAAAPVPVIDLRALPAVGQHEALERIGGELMAARRRSPLPYAPVIVSLSDLDHCVLIAADHLVWDGLSGEALRQRLLQHLQGRAGDAPLHRYRDHVAAAWRTPEPSAGEALESAFDRMALVAAIQATQQQVARRVSRPLHSVRVQVPLEAAAGTPAEQAFAFFKRCLRVLTGLERHGVLLNHHGRQPGGEPWFDVVGPFIDKLPFVVTDDTRLEAMVEQVSRLQTLGIHFLGVAQAPGSAWAQTLPPLADEVLFNFIGDMPQPSATPDQGDLMNKLQEFRGILFEAAAGPDTLELHCAFRGNAADATAVRRELGGAERAGVAAAAPLAKAATFAPHVDKAPAVSRAKAALAAFRKRPAAAAPRVEPAATPLADAPTLSLEVRDVHKTYGAVEAVRGVSFSVPQGSCFGILGPNGAGKTSLLAMIEGLVPVSAGSIRLLGMDVATDFARIQPHLGVQLQQNNYFQFLTVAQLLRFYQDLRAAVGGRRESRPVSVLLERLNLQDKLNAKVDELSGGQKQRLSIAIALLEDPDVVFLDEPTSALDPHSRIATWEFIEDLKRDPRKTIVLTTHYMEEAERLCDEILLMDKGRVIAQGGPAQLIQQLAARQTLHFEFGRGQFPPTALEQLRQTHDAAWDARCDRLTLMTTDVTTAMRDVLALSQAERIDLTDIEINRPTLEQVFLSKTGKELKS
jgi:amino acid adenylation domain-containing protein